MAEGAVVHIGENSPGEVAFKLMTWIANAEGRQNYGHGTHPVTREWILKAYAQCLGVVRDIGGDSALDSYQPESFSSPSGR